MASHADDVSTRLYADLVYPWILKRATARFDDQRRRLFQHARGRVLEIGVGTGASLEFYPPAVTEVVGIEPHRAVLDKAREHVEALNAHGLSYPIRLDQGDAQDMPYDDASFDTVVAFLTLCSIPDPDAAAREMLRVLKPDGQLLVLEHVRAAEGSRLRRWQARINPLWSRAAVGCQLIRPTGHILRNAGFDTSDVEYYREGTIDPTGARIRGVARPG